MASALQAKDLLRLLQELFPSAVLESLYRSVPACLAVYRELPDLARQYVMRLLFISAGSPVPLMMVRSWAGAEQQETHLVSVNKLLNLRIWQKHDLPGRTQAVTMASQFQESIKTAILGGGSVWLEVDQSGDDKHSKDADYVMRYANERWESILRFMVAAAGSHEGVSREVVGMLVEAGLMASPSPGDLPVITPLGFQFLLLSQPAQIWAFITKYLHSLQARGLNVVECLVFLMQINFATVGRAYSVDGLSSSQLQVVQHLREFGLVYQRKRTERRYYPTHLAVNLLSGAKQDADGRGEKSVGYIILETNYHLTAYTDSPLQVSILGLFCQLQYRFPNMVMGVITRESVHGALQTGITAEQILTFLRAHAHPRMLTKEPVIPPTITDQIRLWEMERDRLTFSEGVLYNQFMSMNDYETLRNYAEEIGVLMWKNDTKRLMVVSRAGHDQVKRFWKKKDR